MRNEINVNLFAQQIQQINWRLAELYKGATIATPKPSPELLPVAFKELGIASETLQVALEELRQQNEELAAARGELEAERYRYQELFDLAPQGYLVTDAEGTIREANRAATKLLNVSPEFLVGKPLVIFIPQEERRIFRNELTRLHEQQRVYEWTIRLQPRKGEIFDAGITVATTHNGEGKAVTLRWLIRDITERKRVEAALEKNNYDIKQNRPVQVYSKGEIIPLDPQNLWLVCRGLVKLSTMSDNCEEVLVGLVGPSMPFGSCLTALSTYQAIAVSEVQIVNIPVSEIAASPHLAQTILPKINLRLRQTESLLAISGQRRLQDRLQNLLLLLKQEVGEPVPQGTRLSVRLTHQDLANACCVTRVTITRLLGKLQQEGKISFDSKYHIILKDGSF